MGSADIDNFMVNGDLTHDNLTKPVARLHDIVHRLEEENEFLLPLRQNEKSPTERSTTNGFLSHDKTEELGSVVDPYSLENVPPLDDTEFDEVDYEKDDSWLYSTPRKFELPGTPVKNADEWLRENAVTPELLRVRGSLTEKLEVIAIENRKGSYERLKKSKEDFRKGSTLSLDWDFEDDELSSLGGGSLGVSRIDEFGSDPDISVDWGSELGTVLPRSVQAWADTSMPPDDYIPRSSPPDWSDDDDDDFGPMKINLSQSQCQPRKSPANNMTFKRGQNIAAVRPRTNNEQNEFTAKPTGAVKPRRSAPQRDIDMQYEEERYSSPSPIDFDDSAPVVPRGRLKKDIRTVSPGGYEDPVSAPVILRGTNKRTGASSDAASPRGPANIVKPVQRRKPLDSPDGDNIVRPRGSATNNPNQVRPRGGGNINKSPNNMMESPDASLKVSLSSMGGEGAAVRRRGPVQTAEVAPMPRRSMEPSPRRAKDHSPRRSRDPLTAVRQQEVAPVRRSTGSLPQPRGNDNIARPRRSFSPTGVARPRGAPPM